MSTKIHAPSTHLTAARELLDQVGTAPEADVQAKATAANAHAILVLAEQVAAARVILAADAVSKGANGRPAPQA